MKPRWMSSTGRLVAVAWLVLFVFFSSFLCFGFAVTVDLAATPLDNPIGCIVSTELHVGGDVHDPQHVDDVGVRGIKTDSNILLALGPIYLDEVLMSPVLQSDLNGQAAHLTFGLGSPCEESADQIDDRGGRPSDNRAEKYKSLWGCLDDGLIWDSWHGLPMWLWIVFGGCLGWSMTYALWFGSIYLFRKVSSISQTNA